MFVESDASPPVTDMAALAASSSFCVSASSSSITSGLSGASVPAPSVPKDQSTSSSRVSPLACKSSSASLVRSGRFSGGTANWVWSPISSAMMRPCQSNEWLMEVPLPPQRKGRGRRSPMNNTVGHTRRSRNQRTRLHPRRRRIQRVLPVQTRLVDKC